MQCKNAFEGPVSEFSAVCNNPYNDRFVVGSSDRCAVGKMVGAVATLLAMAVLCFGMIWLLTSFAGK